MGVQSRIPPQHPVVDETHRKLRLKWAKGTKKLGHKKSGHPRVRLKEGDAFPF